MTYIGQQPATTFDSGIQDRFTGLTTNTVTLTHDISAETDILVVWNNIVQDSGTYSVGGTGNKTLTLGGTLVSADIVTVYYTNKVMQSVNPTANSVGITELNLSDGSNGQAITTNGSGTLSFATTGGDLSFGGDTFGADKTIGSNDAYALSFETNNAVGLKIDNAGHVTKPLQSAFHVQPSSDQSNMSADGDVTIVFATERFDRNADFGSNVFTAPVTGIYQFNVIIEASQMDGSGDTYSAFVLKTSNHTYRFFIDYNSIQNDSERRSCNGSIVCDMDASDTAFIEFYQNSGSAQCDIIADETVFSGYLVA